MSIKRDRDLSEHIHMCMCVYIFLVLLPSSASPMWWWQFSLPVISDSLWPHGDGPPGFSVHGIFQARILDGCHFLLPGIFPTQGLNPHLLHCKWILYWLSHQGGPILSILILVSKCCAPLNKTRTPWKKMDDSRVRHVYFGAGILCGLRKKGRDWRIFGHGKGAKKTP